MGTARGRTPSVSSTPQHRAAGNTLLPATVWLALRSSQSTEDERGESLVPDWALRRIRTEFTIRPGQPPASLLHVVFSDTRPGMDARARLLDAPAGDEAALTPPVVLAQFPDTSSPSSEGEGAAGRVQPAEDDLPGFFYRVHRLLRCRDGGLLLVACRQRHREDGELSDPCGQLIACGRSAGFVYRQHIVIVHATASGNRLHPTDDAPADEPGPWWRHRTIHTDLLVFTPA
jgi:hypothetical protein